MACVVLAAVRPGMLAVARAAILCLKKRAEGFLDRGIIKQICFLVAFGGGEGLDFSLAA